MKVQVKIKPSFLSITGLSGLSHLLRPGAAYQIDPNVHARSKVSYPENIAAYTAVFFLPNSRGSHWSARHLKVCILMQLQPESKELSTSAENFCRKVAWIRGRRPTSKLADNIFIKKKTYTMKGSKYLTFKKLQLYKYEKFYW